MIEWGINALNHGSSLAVFKDGKLKFWNNSTEDRLPSSFIHTALGHGSPDKIYWYEQPWVKKARQIYAGQYSTAFDLKNLPCHYLKQAGLSYSPVVYTPHHASHAAAGYYTSPFNDCAVVVLDAIGEFESATIWHAGHGELKKVWSRSYPNSLGLFYSAFTKLVGLEPIRQEAIFEKMAEQGNPKRFYDEVKDYMDTLVRNTRNLHRGVQDWPYEIDNLQTQCDIAAAVQQVFQDQVYGVFSLAKDLTDSDCVVYMGGCAFNKTANKQINDKFKYVWSLPNPGDASSSLGAVLYHQRYRVWDWQLETCKHIDIKV